jgi:hypothetical protein
MFAHSLKILVLIFIFLLSSCNFFQKQKGNSQNSLLVFLGLQSSTSISETPPKYRLDGYLRSLTDVPLRRHTISFKNLDHLTNDSGYFSLYLNPGEYNSEVQDATSKSIGSFKFSTNDSQTLPTLSYSENATFKIVWNAITVVPQSTIDPNAGKASLVINEISPGISLASGGDFVEFYVRGGGNLTGISLCVRTTCITLPEVKTNSGDYIILHEGEGINDASLQDGSSATAWDFYGLPSLSTTDSVIYLNSVGTPYESVATYANADGTWTGCGSSGNTSCLTNILNAGQWVIAGESWDETDANGPTTSKSYGANDTIIRCPNGSYINKKSFYIYSSNLADRSLGSANLSCPGFNVVSASSLSANTVLLTFSADPTIGGSTKNNYSIYEGISCSGTELVVNQAIQSASTVTLTTATQIPGKNYTVCLTDIFGGVDNSALIQSSMNFSGYAPAAQLTINEVAPALANGTDFVELYVISGGTTQGLSLCNRSTCTSLPSRIVSSGEYIVFSAQAGSDDLDITSGSSASYWEFYGAPNMETTDSIVYLALGSGGSQTILSALAYANGDGSWTGTTSINQVVAQGKWPQAGGVWAETDALIKTPAANYGSSDTIIKIPNGTGTDNLSVWQVTNSISQRTAGSANSTPTPPPNLNAGDIVINEMRRASNGHFLEIFNNTGSSIDLAAANIYFYRASTCNADLTTITWTNKFLLSGVIPANGYYLVTSVSLGISENQVQSFSYGSNGCVILTKSSISPTALNDSSIIDLVGWGTSPVCKGTCAADLADKASLRRTSGFQAILSGNNNAEFTLNTNCAGTPKVVNSTNGGCYTQANNPNFSPVAGYYASSQSVTITSTNADQIRYSIDGTSPNCYGSGTLISGSSGSVTISSNLTLKAVGCVAGIGSLETSGDYQIGGTPPATINAGDIVINELRRQSTGSAHWIEFYNRTASPIDLLSVNAYFHRISSCTSSWLTNTINSVQLTGTIPANGYYLLSLSSPGPGGTDQVGSFGSLTDNNCVFLTKSASRPSSISDATIVDIVGYGTATAFGGSGAALNLTNGSILHRIPNGNNTSNNMTAFSLLSTCDGTPKSSNLASCPDTTPPTVTSVSPVDTSTNIAVSSIISITFNEAMNASTITTNTTDSNCSGSIQVSESSSFSTCVQMASLSASSNTYTLTPNSNLTSNQTYYVKVTTAVKDASDNALSSNFSSSFTTGSGTPSNLIVNGSFESDNNSCQQQNSPVGCPNSWVYQTGAATSTLSAVAGGTPTGGGSNYGTLSSWTTTYTGREIRSNCFSLDKSKNLSLQGYFLKDSANSTQIRFLIYYFTDVSCSSPSSTPSRTFTGQTISAQSVWELKTNSETSGSYPAEATLYIKIAVQGQRASSGGIQFDLLQATQP